MLFNPSLNDSRICCRFRSFTLESGAVLSHAAIARAMASSRALALARDAVAPVVVVASMAHRAATNEDRPQSSSPHGDRDGDASRLDRRRRAESVPLASASQGASVFVVVVVARERERERCDDRR
jgi:hypothetical protein